MSYNKNFLRIFLLVIVLQNFPSIAALWDGGYYSEPTQKPGFRFPECQRYFLSTGTNLTKIQQQDLQQELTVTSEINTDELQTVLARIKDKAFDTYQQINPMLLEVYENSRVISDIIESSIARSKNAARDFLTVGSIAPSIKNVTDSIDSILTVIDQLALDKQSSAAKSGGLFKRFFSSGSTNSNPKSEQIEESIFQLIGFEYNLEKYKESLKKVETLLNTKLRYAKNLKRVVEAEIEYLNLLTGSIRSADNIPKSDKEYLSGIISTQISLMRTQQGLIEARAHNLIQEIELVAKQLLHLEAIDTNITMARAIYSAQFVSLDKRFQDSLKTKESEAREAAVRQLEAQEELRLKEVAAAEQRELKSKQELEKQKQKEFRIAQLELEKQKDLTFIEAIYNSNLESVNPEIIRLMQLYIYGPFGIKHESIESFVTDFTADRVSFADMVYVSVQLLKIDNLTITRRHPLVYPTFTKNLDSINSRVNEYLSNLNLPWNYFALLTYLNRLTHVTTNLNEVKFLETVLKRMLLDSKAIQEYESTDYLNYIGYFAHKVLTEPAGYTIHAELTKKKAIEANYLNNRDQIQEIAKNASNEISPQIRTLLQKLQSMSPEKAKKDLIEFLDTNGKLDLSIHEVLSLLSLSDDILIHTGQKSSILGQVKSHLEAYGLNKLDTNPMNVIHIALNILQRLRTTNVDPTLFNLAYERVHLIFSSSGYYKDTFMALKPNDRAANESDFSYLVKHFMQHPDGVTYHRGRLEQEAQQGVLKALEQQITGKISEIEVQADQQTKDAIEKLSQDHEGFNLVKLRRYIYRHLPISLSSFLYIVNRIPLESTSNIVSETNWGGFFVKKYESILGRDFRYNSTSVISYEVDLILGLVAQLQAPITDPLVLQFLKNLLTKDQEAFNKRKGFSSAWLTEVLKAFDTLAAKPPGYVKSLELTKTLKLLSRKIDMASETRTVQTRTSAVAAAYIDQASPILKKLYFADVSNEFYFASILELVKADFEFNRYDFLLLLGRPPEKVSTQSYPVTQVDQLLKYYKLDTTGSNSYSFHILHMLMLLERSNEPYSLAEEAHIRASFNYLFASYVSESSNMKSTVDLFEKLVNAIFDRINLETHEETN